MPLARRDFEAGRGAAKQKCIIHIHPPLFCIIHSLCDIVVSTMEYAQKAHTRRKPASIFITQKLVHFAFPRRRLRNEKCAVLQSESLSRTINPASARAFSNYFLSSLFQAADESSASCTSFVHQFFISTF
jgi:hypothetical protein